MRIARRKFVMLAIGLVVSGLLLAGCAPEATPTGPVVEPTEPMEEPTEPMEEPAEEVEVSMINTAFEPQQITVSPGTTVTWVNEDGVAHTVTSGTRDNPTDVFDSGNVAAGGTFSFTFEEPGTYEYFCSIHPGMNGTVVVEE